ICSRRYRYKRVGIVLQTWGNISKKKNIIRKTKINQKNIEIIILKSLIIIPFIQIKLTVFLNTLIDIIKEDISSFLYSDLIIIKKILKALNKSYKKLIDTNFKEIDKIRKH
ncbi:MAG: hypothetical protein ACP5O4_06990, partial [bacterium]